MNPIIITNNSSERITVIPTVHNLAIKHEIKGELPEGFNQYKVTVLNREEVRRLLPIAHTWLNGGLK